MICKLSDIMEIIGGGTPKTTNPEYWNGSIPWISVKDFNGERRYVGRTEKSITEKGLTHSSTKLLKNGDLIISARGTVGELAIIPSAMAFNQSCYGLRAKENVESMFLYYLLLNNMNILKHHTHGSVFDTITRNTFESIEIDLPDMDKQKRIAGILSAIDDKIELNTAINENLEQQAQAYFIEIFVTNTKSEWRTGTISDLGNVVGGGTPSKKVNEYYTNTGIAWITPKDLSNNKSKFISHGEIDITDLGLAKSNATLMPNGTILFSSRAPIGYIAIADGQVSTNQGFKSIVPFESIGTAYIYYFLKKNLSAIENIASGSTFKEISGSTMKKFPAIIPDTDSLSKFQQFCNPLFEQQKALEHENQRLSAIRDILLPKLMNGEIDVSRVEA